jgi:predicted transcriptional regulator
MARSQAEHPTDVELEILQVLWRSPPLGLGAIWKELRQRRPVAKTTVASMLNIMLQKKLVARGRSPQGYQWSARVSRDSAARGLLGKLLNHLFEGSARQLVLHLADEGKLSDDDLQELRAALAELKRREPRRRQSGTGKSRSGKRETR